jgi:hypothetical protein
MDAKVRIDSAFNPYQPQTPNIRFTMLGRTSSKTPGQVDQPVVM